MRLVSREEISKEFKIPLASVDERMKELGVEPFEPVKVGRGWCILYDATEIQHGLRRERDERLAKQQQRLPRVKAKPGSSIFDMSWGQAQPLLTARGRTN